jgi:hypothetical protein
LNDDAVAATLVESAVAVLEAAAPLVDVADAVEGEALVVDDGVADADAEPEAVATFPVDELPPATPLLA